MKMLVTGAGGFVGRTLVEHSRDTGERVIGLRHAELDISNQGQVNAILERESPDVLVNCAAWTDVDACESNPARAQAVNAHGPELLAQACRRLDALLITISTDYVFDGEKNGFYTQRDQPNPKSAYATSKLDGERRAQAAWARTVVVRTGYIFGPGGQNFLSSIVERVRRGERVRAIEDCFGTPTYALDLAKRLRQLAALDLPGIYHVVNAGEGASFAEFAHRAVDIAGLGPDLVENISSSDIKRAAARPRYSRLRCLLSPAVGLEPLPGWEESLRGYLASDSAGLPARAPVPAS
jgi:dTDP-4-dehydrorhamnose reductase